MTSSPLMCRDFIPCGKWHIADRLVIDETTGRKFVDEKRWVLCARAGKILTMGSVANVFASLGMTVLRPVRVATCYHFWPCSYESGEWEQSFVKDVGVKIPQKQSYCETFGDRIRKTAADVAKFCLLPCSYAAMLGSGCLMCCAPNSGRKVYASWERFQFEGKWVLDGALYPIGSPGFSHPSVALQTMSAIEVARQASVSLTTASRHGSNDGSDNGSNLPLPPHLREDHGTKGDAVDDSEEEVALPQRPRMRRNSVVASTDRRRHRRQRSGSLSGVRGSPRSPLLSSALPYRSYSGGGRVNERSDSPGAAFDGAEPSQAELESESSSDEGIGMLGFPAQDRLEPEGLAPPVYAELVVRDIGD